MINEIREYKDKQYRITDIAEMKLPSTREWTSCVIYEQLESGRVFVREFSDFYNRFKKVE